MKHNTSKKALLLLALFLLPLALCAKEIAVYHTSDTHGYFFPHKNAKGETVGGFATFEHMLKNEALPFILLDAGDFANGNKEANDHEGKLSIDLMNRAGNTPKNFKKRGYAALTIGNHDSDYGDKVLGEALKNFKGDILAMNIEDFKIKGKKIKPFKFYKVDGAKIAVIGVGLDGPGKTGMTFTEFTPEKLENIMKQVLKGKPDVIIMLAHDSVSDPRKPSELLDTIKQVPSAVENIDIFLGGHAHQIGLKKTLGENGPIFAEMGSYLEGTNRIVIELSDKKNKQTKRREVKNITVKYIPLDPADGEDKEMKEYVDTFKDKTLERVYANNPLLISKYPNGDDSASELPKMMADAIYAHLKSKGAEMDFAAFTVNSVRNDIPAGPLTGEVLAALFPYTEYPATFTIKGKDLKDIMASFIKADPKDAKRHYSIFAYSENVKVYYRLNEKGEVKEFNVFINNEPLDEAKTYKMAALSHLPEGYFEGAPFRGKTANKKVYYDKSSYDYMMSIVNNLPADAKGEKQLTAPRDIRIKLMK